MSSRLDPTTCPALTASHLDSLHAAGIYSTSDIISADLNGLASRCALSITELGIIKKSIIQAADDPLTGMV